MRKEEVTSLIIYFIMIAAAIIVGLTVVKDAINKFRPEHMNAFLFVIVVLVLALLLNVILLEVFHVIGAKLGGYKVTSFNVLGFCWEKKENKWSFRFKDFNGLTGETKIAPGDKKLDLKKYIWLPIFGYAVELASGIVCYSLVSKASSNFSARWLAVAAIIFIICSSLIALYNLVPLKLDTMTDGYRFVLLSKKCNLDAYNELLRVEDLERQGKEVGEVKVFEEITEFTANLNLISVYQHLNKGEYEEAEKLIDMIIVAPKGIDPKTHNRLIAQKIYIQILTKPLEEAEKCYNELANDEIRRFIANDVSMESIRAYILIAGIIEKSKGEVDYACGKIEKARKNAMPSRKVIEDRMYEQALNKVYEVHPKWKEEKTAE